MIARHNLHILLAWRSVFYTVINLIPSAVGLLVLPFVVAVVNPFNYGLFSAFAAITASILTCLEYSVLIRKTYVRHGTGAMLSQTVSSCVIIYFMLVACIIVLAVFLWQFFPMQNLSLAWVILAIITALIHAYMTIQLNLWQISQHAKTYGIFKMLFTMSYTVIMLVLLYGFSMKWQGMAWAFTASGIITLGCGMRRVIHLYQLHWQYDAAFLRQMLRHVITLFPFRLALALFTYFGTLLVLYGAGPAQSGLYGFAFQICWVIALGYDSILAAILPHIVSKTGSDHALDPVMRRRYIIGYCSMVLLASLAIAVIGPYLVTYVFPQSYGGAVAFIAWLALARALHGINRLFQELCLFGSQPYFSLSLSSLFAAGFYVLISLCLIHHYGGIGGAMGMAAGHGVWLLVVLWHYICAPHEHV